MAAAKSNLKRALRGQDATLRKALKGDFVLDNWHEHRVCRDTFTIYVASDPRVTGDFEGGEGERGVEHHMADRLELNLHVLSTLDPTRVITVMLASCGGNWEEGLQMMGALVTCPNPIRIIATKHARSMTSIIPLAADQFLLRPPCQYMIHYGYAAFEGLAGAELETWTRECEEEKRAMVDLYVDRCLQGGKYASTEAETIRAKLLVLMDQKSDVFWTADEAVEWGFADGLFLGHGLIPEPVVNAARRARVLKWMRAPRDPRVKGSL